MSYTVVPTQLDLGLVIMAESPQDFVPLTEQPYRLSHGQFGPLGAIHAPALRYFLAPEAIVATTSERDVLENHREEVVELTLFESRYLDATQVSKLMEGDFVGVILEGSTSETVTHRRVTSLRGPVVLEVTAIADEQGISRMIDGASLNRDALVSELDSLAGQLARPPSN